MAPSVQNLDAILDHFNKQLFVYDFKTVNWSSLASEQQNLDVRHKKVIEIQTVTRPDFGQIWISDVRILELYN